ncbi:DNA mismatch endonuclease Vsr [Mesorhizobium sp. M1A.F.Ca.IN.022.02.1.1]|uniref:very short patch repair endonuclease n=1 Tax=Mesorhizobium sp. M1A.F.Ca.IN.022.02.1.1 TaxID=2496766 RepID=UPI000FCAAD3C|nr:very short patch repair endonuclease [Mesorhizobium sp. M1A.F.Ca.IN.022.02.1.1]RUV57361.1 DNA mismatch endonuclease Vsr [Mesorhizobium sp. M1A.F.Ca.IN.022.02.1.1]
MVDVVDSATRSRMMAGIKGKNTKPEIAVRKALHAQGLRYRVHAKEVPGRPDLVLPKYRAAIFVHGCFWHGHDCELFRLPSTRTEFWAQKIESNRQRDAKVGAMLASAGWRELTIWECAFRGAHKIGFDEVIQRAIEWIKSRSAKAEIRGKDGARRPQQLA